MKPNGLITNGSPRRQRGTEGYVADETASISTADHLFTSEATVMSHVDEDTTATLMCVRKTNLATNRCRF